MRLTKVVFFLSGFFSWGNEGDPIALGRNREAGQLAQCWIEIRLELRAGESFHRLCLCLGHE